MQQVASTYSKKRYEDTEHARARGEEVDGSDHDSDGKTQKPWES